MIRPFQCFVCGTAETSIAYAQDPWCGDECHKRLAFLLGTPQFDLKPNEFESALRRIAKQFDTMPVTRTSIRTSKIQMNLDEIKKEIIRGRNGVEVYGSEALLREAERSGNWRDSALRPTLAGWKV